jgi:hypothetical protein
VKHHRKRSRDAEETVQVALGFVRTSRTVPSAHVHANIARSHGATAEELSAAWDVFQEAYEAGVVTT